MDSQSWALLRLFRDPPRLMRPFLRAVRDRHWRRTNWSGDSDREFHDAVFARYSSDPFTFSYPGYVTIRRFADLAAEHFPSTGIVVDLGCGPGEITCELARRHQGVRLIGVDHSTSAIERARQNAERLGLGNVTFVCANAERYSPSDRVDLVLMFDSFHHFLEPETFGVHAATFTDRVFLIEPAGNYLGQWAKGIDIDWLLIELDKIRVRLESAVPNVRLPPHADRAVSSVPLEQGVAVEHRYTTDDLQRFFDGYGLKVRGTVAGFEVYPPGLPGISPVRDHFGRLAYELVLATEEALTNQGLDLLAKHWAIYADRDLPAAEITLPHLNRTNMTESASRAQGAHDVLYVAYRGPASGLPGETFLASVELENKSWRAWSSESATAPILLSYHWADKAGNIIVHDGLRTPLPRRIDPGARCHTSLRVQVPEHAGHLQLLIDLVEEGVAWFSAAGCPPLKVPFRVRRR